jgi:hypothetical protein
VVCAKVVELCAESQKWDKKFVFQVLFNSCVVMLMLMSN